MGPSQGSPDGLLDFLRADLKQLTVRLGVQFRQPLLPAPPPNSLLRARYIRIQVASPPPKRTDGTAWDAGLVVNGGALFDRDRPPADGQVFPLGGIAPLSQPEPETIVLDRWVAVPVVPPTQALTRTVAFGSNDPTTTPLSFSSSFYPEFRIDGTVVAVAGITYYTQGDLVFDRSLDIAKDGHWIAVSLERFFPPERASADYIVRVRSDPFGASVVATDAEPMFPVTVAWNGG